jgi:hypothetical protein
MTAPGLFLLINLLHYTHLHTTFKVQKSKDIEKRQIINFQRPGYSNFSMSLSQNNVKKGTHPPEPPPITPLVVSGIVPIPPTTTGEELAILRTRYVSPITMLGGAGGR